MRFQLYLGSVLVRLAAMLLPAKWISQIVKACRGWIGCTKGDAIVGNLQQRLMRPSVAARPRPFSDFAGRRRSDARGEDSRPEFYTGRGRRPRRYRTSGARQLP